MMIVPVRYPSGSNISKRWIEEVISYRAKDTNKLHILYMIIRNNNLYPVLIAHKTLIMF